MKGQSIKSWKNIIEKYFCEVSTLLDHIFMIKRMMRKSILDDHHVK